MNASTHRQHHVKIVESFDLAQFELGSTTKLRVSMVGNGIGGLISLPVVILRGVEPGPVMGLTAAIHGNELNGMRVIQKVIAHVKPTRLKGTVICVPVVNVPGYLNNTRHFNDGYDLNRVMPGKRNGTNSQVYAHRFMTRIVAHLDYMIDLHTASFGRINTLYVRADMTNPDSAWMALCQQPQIVLHNTGADGTLRGAAMDRGVKSITVEVGNPNAFQSEMVDDGTTGVLNVLSRLKMIEDDEQQHPGEPVVCVSSYWMYTEVGGVLEVYPQLAARIRTGEVVACVRDIYGDLIEEYRAPEDGIIIGRATHPVNQTGSRVIHLGIEGTIDPTRPAPAAGPVDPDVPNGVD
ncbi:succinylglutamate desuccinylase/aspartoacylase family protein [Enhygromyxa salina]|uniref:Succinylglutamate desuccinylase / Aspartoacylase family protein n=1 Tax=Enhygromyxa salina TaxID=215803 RepID=A0A2S9XTM7_9BACT|nr:succinylglutamate desuccinylase/aspartoacylase family protein [Enhygromyxa salina]PRP96215.1 Succinylglutamate desuccinylase / Aspartoacylase family protein [Enhygromyxa salina]